MDFLLWFFRDFLDGPLYIIVLIISIILICAGIGYFAEIELNKRRDKEKFNSNYMRVGYPNKQVNTSVDTFVNNNSNSTNLARTGNIFNNQVNQGVNTSSNMVNVENNQVNINNK